MSVTLSIVTINFNDINGLSRTLSSLSEMKSRENVEFLFVDGGSKDESVALAKDFYAPDKTVSEPDLGPYDAMNKGLAMAHGKYVLWLNSGDELNRGCEDLVLSELERSYAKVISFSVIMRGQAEDKTQVPSIGLLPEKALPHQSTCFLRSACVEVGWYDLKYRVAADRDYEIRFLLRYGAGAFLFSPIVSSIFYLGGLSSRDYALETRSIDYRHGLVSPLKYVLEYFRLRSRPIRRWFQRLIRG